MKPYEGEHETLPHEQSCAQCLCYGGATHGRVWLRICTSTHSGKLIPPSTSKDKCAKGWVTDEKTTNTWKHIPFFPMYLVFSQTQHREMSKPIKQQNLTLSIFAMKLAVIWRILVVVC